jgi:outer membrane lipoprotein-sorting protein
MNKLILILVLAVCCILPAGNGEAFVPQTPHLLHLMIQKIKRPAGMVVHQTRNLVVSDNQDSLESTPGPKSIVLEKLTYLFPGKFRSDIISDTVTRFYVESDSRFVKVGDGNIVSLEKSPVDFYTDPLLYREYEYLLQKLTLVGVDTTRVSFKRFDNKICYFIGGPSLDGEEQTGLWIEKENFFPVRYVIKKNGWMVSFHYENWQRVSKSWYPMQISIFVDNQLFTRIDVQQFELTSGFSAALFDVNTIQRQYPGEKAPDEFDELDRQIENFKKLYE